MRAQTQDPPPLLDMGPQRAAMRHLRLWNHPISQQILEILPCLHYNDNHSPSLTFHMLFM